MTALVFGTEEAQRAALQAKADALEAEMNDLRVHIEDVKLQRRDVLERINKLDKRADAKRQLAMIDQRQAELDAERNRLVAQLA